MSPAAHLAEWEKIMMLHNYAATVSNASLVYILKAKNLSLDQ